jgi:serine/threonine-protein kinase
MYASEPPVIEGLGPLAPVARGGMGRVYRAADLATGHPVGVKAVDHEDSSPESLVRFLQEGEILARLDHPNIVRLIRCGSHPGGLHIVMEWVGGGTLAAHCGKPHDPAQAAALVATVADAVEFAHRRGVIHRDLKPANVLLVGARAASEDKEPNPTPAPSVSSLAALTPKVSDFGIARLTAAGRTVTATGEVLGTAAFMPPEQVLGRHDEIGPASDVYALGAILYVLLTGVTPFEGRRAVEVIQQVVADDPIAPSILAPGVPARLSETCLRCLAKLQAARFTSAAGLADVLRQASA